MRGILEAVASSAYYPETSSAPALNLLDRSAHALAAAEAEQAAAERRQELFVLFRNGAKIFPEEAYAVVGPRLQALVSEADTDFQVNVQSSLRPGHGIPQRNHQSVDAVCQPTFFLGSYHIDKQHLLGTMNVADALCMKCCVP